MTSGASTIVEQILVPHTAFAGAIARLEQCFAFAEGKGEAESVAIVGESGTGKTSVLEAFRSKHKPWRSADGREVPVLFASTPSAPTPKSLAGVLLFAIGAEKDAEQGTENYRTNRLKQLMKEAGTRMVMIDEFQQFYDRGRRRVMHEVADWLKLLIDQTRTTLVVAGLENAQTVIDSNEQLARRSLAPVRLPRFLWRNDDHREQLLAILDEFFEKISKEFDLPYLGSDEMAYRLYCATGGLMGYLSKLLRQTLRNASAAGRKVITLEDLNIAHGEAIWSSSRIAGLPKPFAADFAASETIETLEIVQKIGTVPDLPELPIRRRSGRTAEKPLSTLLKAR